MNKTNTLSDAAKRIDRAGLQVDAALDDLICNEILPGTGIEPATFYDGLSNIVIALAAKNQKLLERRDELQASLDRWYAGGPGGVDPSASEAFLREIGYLVPEGPDFEIETSDVDPEIATIAGPQLVVPVNNARYCINAANARWGSLYDALYGTDVIADEGEWAKGGGYNAARGDEVIRRSMEFLDTHVPWASASMATVRSLSVSDGDLVAVDAEGNSDRLSDPAQFVGYVGDPSAPSQILLKHHGCTSNWSSTRMTPSAGSTPRASKT